MAVARQQILIEPDNKANKEVHTKQIGSGELALFLILNLISKPTQTAPRKSGFKKDGALSSCCRVCGSCI
jgi:hypothetical protein